MTAARRNDAIQPWHAASPRAGIKRRRRSGVAQALATMVDCQPGDITATPCGPDSAFGVVTAVTSSAGGRNDRW